MKYEFQECIGSRVRSLSRKLDGIYRKHLSNSAVTENQLSIMMALYKMGTIEQNQIAKFLNLEKSSLSRNLVRLIGSGYIKKQGPTNRPMIGLSTEGKTLVDELVPKWEMAMEEIHSILDKADIVSFNQFERRVSKL